jgi:hypothetical protein
VLAVGLVRASRLLWGCGFLFVLRSAVHHGLDRLYRVERVDRAVVLVALGDDVGRVFVRHDSSVASGLREHLGELGLTDATEGPARLGA